MNTLVEQFIAEARDYLDEAARGLLELEQSANDANIVNGIFRNFHTIKGTSGIFPEFQPITTLTHAAEDLMDQVRNGLRALDTASVDLLLATLDLTGSWLEYIEQYEVLPANAASTGQELRGRLLEILSVSASPEEEQAQVGTFGPSEEQIELARWVKALGRDWPEEMLTLTPPPLAICYRPDSSCFFMGEDPVNLICQLQSPLVLEVTVPSLPSSLDELDPFSCQIEFRLVLFEDETRIKSIFNYVEDQLVMLPVISALESQETPVSVIDMGPEVDITWASGRSLPPPPSLTVQEEAKLEQVVQEQKKGSATTYIRIDQRLINSFMDLVGELLVARNSLPYLSQRAKAVFNVPTLADELDIKSDSIGIIVESLQDIALQMRMMPVAKAFERFPRLVRDISNKLGKKIALVMEGEDTQADKDVIEALGEPLVHMVRNSLDHGIEIPDERLAAGKSPEGKILLRAFQEAGSIVVEIVDDGKGIDPVRIRNKAAEKGVASVETLAAMSDEEIIQLIFAPNFSTADAISDLSGRGVGMDAVQTMVNNFGGTAYVTSKVGHGSTVRLSLPLSMAITRILTISQGDCTFGIPSDSVLETLNDIRTDRIKTLATSPGLDVRGELIPLYSLGRQLEMEDTHQWFPDRFSAVVISVRGETVALAVDDFDDIIDAVIKPTTGLLAKSPYYTGTTILGDGKIMLLLNLPKVI